MAPSWPANLIKARQPVREAARMQISARAICNYCRAPIQFRMCARVANCGPRQSAAGRIAFQAGAGRAACSWERDCCHCCRAMRSWRRLELANRRRGLAASSALQFWSRRASHPVCLCAKVSPSRLRCRRAGPSNKLGPARRARERAAGRRPPDTTRPSREWRQKTEDRRPETGAGQEGQRKRQPT